MQSSKTLLHFPEELLKYLFTLFRPLDSFSMARACKRLRAIQEKNNELQENTEKRKLQQKLSGLNQRINDKEVLITIGGRKKTKTSESIIYMPIYKNVSKITEILYVDNEKIVFMAETGQEREYCATHRASLESLLNSGESSVESKKRKILTTFHSSVIEPEELQNTIVRYKKRALLKSLYLDALEIFKELFVGFELFKGMVLFETSPESTNIALKVNDIASMQYDVLKPILKRLKEAGVIDYETKNDCHKFSYTHNRNWQQHLTITLKDFTRISSACAELKPLADFINDFLRTFHTEFTHSCSNDEAEQKILELHEDGEIPYVYHFDANSKDWILSYLQENKIHHAKVSHKAQACEILATLFEAHKVTLQPMQIDKKMSI